jgi:hypothetical protein
MNHNQLQNANSINTAASPQLAYPQTAILHWSCAVGLGRDPPQARIAIYEGNPNGGKLSFGDLRSLLWRPNRSGLQHGASAASQIE